MNRYKQTKIVDVQDYNYTRYFKDLLGEYIDFEKFEKIFGDLAKRKILWSFSLNSEFDFKIECIELKILRDQQYNQVELKNLVNIITGEKSTLEILSLLLKKVFLSIDNTEIENDLLLFYETNKEKLDPEIGLSLRVNGKSIHLGYNFLKNAYYINHRLVPTKKQYFYKLIRFLKYKDYPDILVINPSNANTRLKKLRESLFIDLNKSNQFLKESNDEFKLFFESECSISIQILYKVLNKESKLLQKKIRKYSEKISKIETNLRDLNSKLNILDISEKKQVQYRDLIVKFNTKEELKQEILSLSEELAQVENLERNREKLINLENNQQDIKNNIFSNNQEIKKIEFRIAILNGDLKKINKRKTELIAEQRKLSLLKVNWKNNFCYCGGNLPEAIKDIIELKGECPICKKTISFDLENEKRGLQQKINRKKQSLSSKLSKIDDLHNQIDRIEVDNEELYKKIEEVEKSISSYKKSQIKNTRIISLREEIKKLEYFEWDFDSLKINDELKTKFSKDISSIVKSESKLNERIEKLQEELNDLTLLLQKLNEVIVELSQIKEKLGSQFANIQEKLIKKFIGKKLTPIKAKAKKDFSEIILDFVSPFYEPWIIHLNYFLSILELNSVQNSTDSRSFHNYPFLSINNIQNIEILKKVIKHLLSLKKKEIQAILFFPDVKSLDFDGREQGVFIHRLKTSNTKKPKKVSPLEKFF